MASTINASTTAGLVQSADLSGSLQLQTANTAALTIDTSQNVGIGTTSPSSKLSVGTASYSQSPSTAQINGTNISTSNTGGLLNIGSTDSAAANIGGSLGFTANGGLNGYPTGQISGRRESATSSNYSSYLAFTTSDSSGTLAERMRIDSSGNVGIGTSSPSSFDTTGRNLVVGSGSGNQGISIYAATTGYSSINFTDGTTGADKYTGQITYYHTDNALIFGTNGGTERMRIDSSGSVLVNTTSNAGQLTSSANGSSQNPLALIDTGTTYNTGIYFIRFVNSAGNTAGSVQHTAVATVAYSTTSDKRLKENIVDAPEALDKVMAVKIRSYDWKDDVSHVDYGVIAQELYEVIPEVVGKGDDTETIENEKGTWQVEYGRLTPILIKAIQELSAKVDAQQQEINALKGNV